MAKRDKNSRNRRGVVYSTNEDYNYAYEEHQEETVPSDHQDLRVMLDKKQRRGKQVTLIKEFIGSEHDLKELGKLLQSKCGTGGSAKDGDILLQGNGVDRILNILINEGYRAKKAGG